MDVVQKLSTAWKLEAQGRTDYTCGSTPSCHVEMNQGQEKALRALLFTMLKMMLKAYL
jgi:hypothetical protein